MRRPRIGTPVGLGILAGLLMIQGALLWPARRAIRAALWPPDPPWRYDIRYHPNTPDYIAECDVTLLERARSSDGTEDASFGVYRALENLGGYEAALVVRYQSPALHYRIALSTRWQELLLWSPAGGVTQVCPFPFRVGRRYRLRVECRGARLLVSIDGTPRIDWHDRAAPVLSGAVGIASRRRARFSPIRVDALSAPLGSSSLPTARLDERSWHGRRWFFDGYEPLFTLSDANLVDHVKLVPGYRPLIYFSNYVTDWQSFYPRKIRQFRVLERGRRLRLEVVAEDPGKPGVDCRSLLTVTLDATRQRYRYDHRCELRVRSREAARGLGNRWDQGDVALLGSVGSAQTTDPSAPAPRYRWLVFRGSDSRLYRLPLNHNGHYEARQDNRGGALAPHDAFTVAVGDPHFSPVTTFPQVDPPFTHAQVEVCPSGYDQHAFFHLQSTRALASRTVLTTRLIYTAWSAADARNLLARAAFQQPRDLSLTVPVFSGGVGSIERFARSVLLASLHQEPRIWNGQLDPAVGHGDRSSLRLDGPTQAWTVIGPSYFTAPFAYDGYNRVTAWIRTRNADGQGPEIGISLFDPSSQTFSRTRFFSPHLTGTHDWRRFSFDTTFLNRAYGAILFFRNCGGGTTWIDDFSVRPVPAEGLSWLLPHPDPAEAREPGEEPVTVLDWHDAGGPDYVLDRSGHGHHGKLFGGARWSTEAGKQFLSFAAPNTYVWPLESPRLDLASPCTVEMEVRPRGAGVLLGWPGQFSYRTVPAGGGYALEYAAAGRPPVRSRPFLSPGVWQRLSIRILSGRVELFRDGLPVDTLAVRPTAARWQAHFLDTHYRHPSLFGTGPELFGNQPPGFAPRWSRGEDAWTGDLASLTIRRER